jgi:AcrR family transcriptional regulator
MTIRKAARQDRRIARTQELLREALHSLIHERDYDSIAVKEILGRANVGRSAFYMHFRDKDDLLAATFQDILGSVSSMRRGAGDNHTENLHWFSLPIFEHLDHLRRAGELKLGPRGRIILHGHLQKVLVRLIASNLGKAPQNRRKRTDRIPLELLVQHVASTFILVLNWWVDSRSTLNARQVNDLFRALILPIIGAIAD